MSNLAVAANPPVPTGPAPATAGVSSPTVAPADAAGGRDQVFSFPVTIYATATIAGEIEDEARNTIGCDLRDALADESSVDLDNGGTLNFERFEIAAPVQVAECPHCGRDNAGHEDEPCADDCPQYWEAKGRAHPEHPTGEVPAMVEALRWALSMAEEAILVRENGDDPDDTPEICELHRAELERHRAILARIDGKA